MDIAQNLEQVTFWPAVLIARLDLGQEGASLFAFPLGQNSFSLFSGSCILPQTDLEV